MVLKCGFEICTRDLAAVLTPVLEVAYIQVQEVRIHGTYCGGLSFSLGVIKASEYFE